VADALASSGVVDTMWYLGKEKEFQTKLWIEVYVVQLDALEHCCSSPLKL
jgi:hypothetical protein